MKKKASHRPSRKTHTHTHKLICRHNRCVLLMEKMSVPNSICQLDSDCLTGGSMCEHVELYSCWLFFPCALFWLLFCAIFWPVCEFCSPLSRALFEHRNVQNCFGSYGMVVGKINVLFPFYPWCLAGTYREIHTHAHTTRTTPITLNG